MTNVRHVKKCVRAVNVCSMLGKARGPRKKTKEGVSCFNLRTFADSCARFAGSCARFALRSLQRSIILEDRSGTVLGKALEAGKRVRLPYFGDDPCFFALPVGTGQKVRYRRTLQVFKQILKTKAPPGAGLHPLSPDRFCSPPHLLLVMSWDFGRKIAWARITEATSTKKTFVDNKGFHFRYFVGKIRWHHSPPLWL